MKSKNYVKAGSIAGLILGILLVPYIVLAPNDHPIKTGRMLIPESSIPKVEGVEAGATPPVSAQITRVLVVAFFVGPFGALVGGGVGILLTGLLQKSGGPKPHPHEDSKEARN